MAECSAHKHKQIQLILTNDDTSNIESDKDLQLITGWNRDIVVCPSRQPCHVSYQISCLKINQQPTTWRKEQTSEGSVQVYEFSGLHMLSLVQKPKEFKPAKSNPLKNKGLVHIYK
jgi:hypothetical protein